MKYLLRPSRSSHIILGSLALAPAWLLIAAHSLHAQSAALAPVFSEPDPLVAHAGPSGYLGVDVTDADADKAQTLKLKEAHGALITLIDHDAPAGQIGLKVNDVVLALNGQNVDGAEQLRRLLHEIPPGRKISLVISRDGNIQTLAVELVDRKAMEQSVWSRIGMDAGSIAPAGPQTPTMGVMGGDAPVPPPSGWRLSLFTSTLNVGAMVEPLTSQMAEYLGVAGGLMVKQVSKKTEAAAAGFKAFDVILKVGADSIATSADWDRALRANQGKQVQVTILRDRKQQTIALQVDSKHRGALEFDDMFADGEVPELAELEPDSDIIRALADPVRTNADSAAAEARRQAEAMRKQLDDLQCQASSAEAEQMRKQAEQLRESMKNFRLDSAQIDQQLRQQMEQFRKNFDTGKVQQQIERQMEEFRKNFGDEQRKRLDDEMRQFRQQMEEWREQSSGHFV